MPNTPPTAPASIPFISYSGTDMDAALELRERLRGASIDSTKLRLSGRWMTELQKVLSECSAFIVLVGRDGVQRWVGAECEVALNRHLSPHGDAPRLPIHPVLLPGVAPEALPPFLALFQAEPWAPGTPLPAGLCDALASGVERLNQGARFEGCPFLGLGTFQRKDAALFFGRQAETMQAVAGLGDQQQANRGALSGADVGGGAGDGSYRRWLQVEGNSGSGKSSLVLAGLLPMVESGALWARTGLANWRVLGPMVPGREPLTNVAVTLERDLDPARQQAPDTQARRQRLGADPRSLEFAVRDAAARAPDTGFLLVIDQFEELYTLAEAGERAQFDALLAAALSAPDCPLFVVSTVRADFLDRIEQLPRLSALYNDRCKHLFLGTISSEGLRDAIERPAQLAGIDVSEVSTAMQEQARDEPGALPLVENALLQLWQARDGRPKISGAKFHERGGLTGMLSAGADALLARIEAAQPKQGRTAALELLLCLTRISPDGRHTRRRVSRAEAVQAAGNGNTALGERVLQMLSGERAVDRPADTGAGSLRLVTTGVEAGEPYADLIHETLLRSRTAGGTGDTPQPYWPTLHAYIDANRDRDVLRQQLALQIGRWQRGGRLTRWSHLAGWGQLLEFQRLSTVRRSVEGQFLASSRRFVVAWATVLTVVTTALIESAWWVSVNGLPLGYMFVQPLWYLGWNPMPQTTVLPPGSFTMGCKEGRDVDAGEKCPDTDQAAHEVTLPAPCQMGRYEVTFLQFDRYVWANGGKGADPDLYPKDANFGRFDRPVINVDWNQAKAYAAWLGNGWRLPSDAEWEYAARGGLEARYPWGNEAPQGKANCLDCGDARSARNTAPVGSYAATGLGKDLHDMAGNVWEWVEDKFDDKDAPGLRGGSWDGYTRGQRASGRYVSGAGNRNNNIGFRVCRVSPIEKPVTGALTTELPNR